MSDCSWWRGGHSWNWEPMRVVGKTFVQYGTCATCGRVKAVEVFLR